MSSRFIHIVACDKISLLFKTEKYFIVFIYHVLFIHLSVGEHLDCFRFLAVVNSGINIDMHMSLGDPVFNSLDIYLEVRLLDYMVIQFLIFYFLLIPIEIAPVHNPTRASFRIFELACFLIEF